MAHKYLFSIRFYYSGREVSDVRRFLRKLPRKHRKKCLFYFNFVRERGTQVPKHIVEKLDANLYELKPEYDNNEYRFLFGLISEKHFGVVTALQKKRERLPQSVFDIARKRVEEMKAREENR